MTIITNMRILMKCLLPLVVLAVAAGGITIFMSARMGEIDTAYSLLIDEDAKAAIEAVRSDTNTSDIWGLSYQIIAENDPATMTALLKKLDGKTAEYQSHIDMIRAAFPNDAKIVATTKTLSDAFAKVQQIAMKAGSLSLKNTKEANDEALALMHKEFDPANQFLGDTSDAFYKSLIARLGHRSDDLSESTNASRLQSMVIAGVAIVLSFGFGLWVALSGIIRPIGILTTSMGRLAQRDWGTEVPGQQRRDELGGMARTVETFKQSGLEADRAAAAERASQAQRDSRAKHIENIVKGFEAKIGDVVGGVASAATEMKATAQSMSSTAAETNRQADSVADAAERTSVGVKTTAAAAEELSSSIGEISRQVAHSASLTEEAVADARRTDGIVQMLAQGAGKIGEVVELITQIAGQTNLLALNATIEAARAGDAGKGFAVVASEVKNLASQTATATEQIASQIGQIQSATEEAVAAIKTISAKISDISATATSIASAVEEQGAATAEIARSVQQTAADTETVTSSISGVSRAATDTGAAASQVLGAAGELSQRAEQMKADVQRFVADVRAA